MVVACVLFLLLIPPITSGGGGEEEGEDLTSRPTREGEMGNWTKVFDWPVSTSEAFMMYREAEGELVVFRRTQGPCEVWSYFQENSTWLLRRTNGVPLNYDLYYTAFVSNSDSSVAYFYGGYDNNEYLDDLFLFFYENMTWMEIDEPDQPRNHLESAMVYDRVRDSIWIFGGRHRRSQWDRPRTNDLYQYNLTEGWTEYDPEPEPAGRDEALLTINTNCTKLYLALGQTDSYDFASDLWEYNISTGEWQRISWDLDIETHAGAIIQYVEETDKLSIALGYHGYRSGNNLNREYTGQCYLIDPSNGSVSMINLTGPLTPRWVRSWDMMGDGSTAVVLGGYEGQTDLCALDLTSMTSFTLEGSPGFMGGSGFTGYDPDHGGQLMVLKPVSGDNSRINDSYSWQAAYFDLTAGTWHGVDFSPGPQPEVRSGMASCYDHVNDRFYVYGGYSSEWKNDGHDWWRDYTFYKEFWSFDVDDGTWQQILFNPPQGKRGRSSMICDAENGMVYLFGGNVTPPNYVDNVLARYDLAQERWDLLEPTISPSARMEGKLAMDAERGGFYLFGGIGLSDSELNDLWFFDILTGSWQPYQHVQDEPTARSRHALSFNSDTEELMVFGDDPQGTYPTRSYLYRRGWLGWEEQEHPYIDGWDNPGLFYSPERARTYAFAGDGKDLEVWEYNPILRTRARLVRMLDTEGNIVSSTINAYPTVGEYGIYIEGTTDMQLDDLVGMSIRLYRGTVDTNITWTRATNVVEKEEGVTWFELNSDPVFETAGSEWNLTVPIEFTFDMLDGYTIDAEVLPLTIDATPEVGRKQNLLTMRSQLEVVGYRFSSSLQDTIFQATQGWLFGRTDLTVSNITVTFKDNPSMQPYNQSLLVNFRNAQNESDSWNYMKGGEGQLRVPIHGSDGSVVTFTMNLTTNEGVELWTKDFDFRLDLDRPGIPINLTLRDESSVDPPTWMDDDATMYLTWDHVEETGSGLKGICYSLDKNLYPAESNLTLEFEKIFPISEGNHILYVWTVDNAGRASDLFEKNLVVDSHMPLFMYPSIDPEAILNTTRTSVVVCISVYDELSGVDPDTIQYTQAGSDGNYLPWDDLENSVAGIPDTVERISLSVDLVPGEKNYVKFRMKDRVGSNWRESPTLAINCRPDLAYPLISLESSLNNTMIDQVGGSINLRWYGDYINPGNLTYKLMIERPDGKTSEIADLIEEVKVFYPWVPGLHRWWVVAEADGMTATSFSLVFTYDPPLHEVEILDMPDIEYGSEAEFKISVDNPLSQPMNYSLSLQDEGGLLVLKTSYPLVSPSGTLVEYPFIINASLAPSGSRTVVITVTDEYGREVEKTMVFVVKEAPEGPRNETDDEEDGSLLPFIIAGIVALLVAIGVVFFIVAGRKREEEEEVEPEPEEEGEYDPTGKVAASHGTGPVETSTASSALSEEQQRRMGSNVMELTIPARDEVTDEMGTSPPDEE